MDGTVTEGRYLPAPRTRAAYMSLAPYDNDTIDILTDVCREHEVYIITARSEPYGHRNIVDWFNKYAYYDKIKPAGIITSIEQPDKYQLACDLKCDLMFDDSPNVYLEYVAYDPRTTDRPVKLHVMDNPNWVKNQELFIPNRITAWRQIIETINHHTT